MKFGFFAFFLFLFATDPVWAEEPDFEGLEWGMSPHEITEVKGSGTIDNGDDYISYWERIQGKKFRVVYKFQSTEPSSSLGLHEIYYFFEDKVEDLNAYVEFYKVLEQSLISSYGNPTGGGTFFTMDALDNIPDHMGQAVADGTLSFLQNGRSAQWELASNCMKKIIFHGWV